MACRIASQVWPWAAIFHGFMIWIMAAQEAAIK